jgi:hypothetical protein
MFSALFPVQKDVMTDGLPAAETPGSAKNGGEGEKNDRFARLLFVSQMRNAPAKEQQQLQSLLFEPRMLSTPSFFTEFMANGVQEEGEVSSSPEEELLQSAFVGALAAPPVLSLELPAGAAETLVFEEGSLVSGEEAPFGSPRTDGAEISFSFAGDESGAARPEGSHPAGKMFASAGEGAVSPDLLRLMEPASQTEEIISSAALEKQPVAKPLPATDAPSGASFSPLSGEPDANTPATRRNTAAFAVAAPAPDPVAEDKAATPSASHFFSLSMTDNVRPRRNLAFAGPLATSAESGDGTATAASRVSSASSLPGRSEAANALASAADAVVSSNAPHHALKAVAESKLSTNDLPRGPEEELNLFPAARSLFGASVDGKPAQSSSPVRTPSEKTMLLTKDDGKEDAVPASGKENSDTAASFSAIRSPQQPGGQPAVFERFVQIPLQGQGGAALEDGVQHVVRFLKAEGRHAASIIIDPPALGRVEVELVTTAKGVEASIKVATEQIRQLVQDHITVLRNHLEQQGVHLGEFVVDLRDNTKGNSGRNAFKEEGGARRRQVTSAGAEDIEENVIPSFRMDLEHGLLAWVA